MLTLKKRPTGWHFLMCIAFAGFFVWTTLSADAQCVRIKDRRRNNAWTFTPKKDFRCLSAGQSPVTTFNMTFESPVSNVTINWGDTVQFYPGPITTASRVYKAAGVYNYTVTESGCPDQIKGIYVNDYNTSCPGVGWIAPPNDSARCLPDSIVMTNFSPGMNGFTEWIINWGDQKKDTADYPSYGKKFAHKYKAGTRICNATISISYRNSCNIVPCGQALSSTFGPYKFMERDSALVDQNTILICGPTDVVVKDVSKLNCKDTASREVSWTALDGFNQPLPNPGNGIWRPRGPVKNQKITIPAAMFTVVPADSIFKIRMRIRNKCGEDTAETIVQMIASAKPNFTIANSNPCVGTEVTFNNLTSNPFGNVDYIWDYGDGTLDTTNEMNPIHIYYTSGDMNVTLKALTKGFGDQVCERILTVPIHVKPAVLPGIQIQPVKSGCDSLVAVVKNKSSHPENATWGGWSFGGSPEVTAGSSYYPGPVTSDPGQIQLLNSNPVDSSAIVKFRNYGLYLISLKGQSPGCAENIGYDSVKVYPSPTLRWGVSALKICQGEPLIIRDSSRVIQTDARGLGAEFNHLNWSLKAGSDTTLTSSSPVITNFDSPFLTDRISVVRFKNSGTFWVKLSVSTPNGCAQSDSVLITVKPSAIPEFTFVKENCDNSNGILKNLTVANANLYIYNIYKGNGILQGQEFASFTKTDKTDQPIFLPYAPPGDSTFYYVVLTAITITNGDSCVVSSIPLVIKIAPTPIPGLNILPADGCNPLNNVNVVNTSMNLPQTGITTFTWDLGDLGTYSGTTPPPLTFTNTTNVNKRDTIRICVQTGDGCSYCTEKVVVTYPSPKAEIVTIDSICSGESVAISANTVGAVTHKWDFTDYDGTSSNQTSLDKVFTNNTNQSKVFTIKLTVRSSADCPFIVEKTLKVNPNPDFAFQTNTVQDANCGPLNATITYLNPINSIHYSWKFGDGDTLETASTDTIHKVYTNETSSPVQNPIRVTATSASGCTTVKQSFITINPLVRARFKNTLDSGCTPLRVVFTDSSTVAANVRRWIINGVPVVNQSEQLTHTFVNTGLTDTVYTVKLAVRNNIGSNCVDTMVRKIKVWPKPRANDLLISPSEGCSPLPVSFNGNVESAVQFNWEFGDGTDTTLNGQDFSHTFYNSHPVSNMTYQVVRYSISSKGCRDTTRRQVVVRPNTQAVISSLQSNGCTPFTVQLSALNSVNANSFIWNFGDGSPVNTSSSPNYTFVNNSDSIQSFTIRLIAKKLQANTCPDTAETIVKVYPAPQADFSTNNNIGCGPLPISLTNTSTGGQSSYWVLSSGGISDTLVPNALGIHDTIIDNPNFAAKTIRVDQTVISNMGCIAKKTQNIQIYPNLTASFIHDSSGCQPQIVKFQNTSENYLGSYTWDFGDGSTSNEKSPLHIYENFSSKDTTFNVLLTSVSPVGNCVRQATGHVHVLATPRADFRFLSDSSIQLPVNTITIGNQSTFRNNWTYDWTYGDGSLEHSGDASFVHTFQLSNEDFLDTNFVVTMIARSPSGCTDTVRKSMVVKPGIPKAEFEATPREGCRPLEVQFTSLSSYARKYEWVYVDKEGSPEIILTDRNPVVFFESAGLKTVKLRIKGLGGQDSIEKVEYINVFETPRASFYVDPTPPSTVVAPEEPAFFIPNDNRTEYQYTWTFGDGDSSNQRSTQHKYAHPGIYDVSLKVVGPNGCWAADTIIGGVVARGDQILAVPTAFTPNPAGSNGGIVGGDGENDVFYPFVKGLSGMTMQIYNRWGQLIFISNKLNYGWDGYYRGKLMPSDSYVYRIVAEFSNGESQTFLGDVTLLR